MGPASGGHTIARGRDHHAKGMIYNVPTDMPLTKRKGHYYSSEAKMRMESYAYPANDDGYYNGNAVGLPESRTAHAPSFKE